jgi:hypothetical protein
MLWALRRRAITLFVILVILLLPLVYLYGKYKANQVFTCTDNKKNGDEVGVDCGGSCVRICQENVKPLITEWAVPVKVTDDVYHMAALISNPNLFALPKISYTLSMYDENNLLIAERKGSTYVPANTSFIVSELLVSVGKRKPSLAFIKFEDASFWQQVDQRQTIPYLKTSNIAWEDTEIGSKLTAVIKNTERVSVSDIEVTAVAFGSNNNVIAISTTVLDSLDQAEVQPVVFTWPAKIDALNTKLYARINPFLGKNGTIALPRNPQYHQK